MPQELTKTASSPVDMMAPWTIKSFSTEMRNLAVRQAQIEGVTVGQWLEQCIRQRMADGNPTRIETRSSQPAYSPLDGLQQLAAINPQLVQDKLTSDRLQALARNLALRAKRETKSEIKFKNGFAAIQAARADEAVLPET